MSLTTSERTILAAVSLQVAGRTNAWTTVAGDHATIDALCTRKLLVHYASGVRITPAGMSALRGHVFAKLPKIAAVELARRDEHQKQLRERMRAGIDRKILDGLPDVHDDRDDPHRP